MEMDESPQAISQRGARSRGEGHVRNFCVAFAVSLLVVLVFA